MTKIKHRVPSTARHFAAEWQWTLAASGRCPAARRPSCFDVHSLLVEAFRRPAAQRSAFRRDCNERRMI